MAKFTRFNFIQANRNSTFAIFDTPLLIVTSQLKSTATASIEQFLSLFSKRVISLFYVMYCTWSCLSLSYAERKTLQLSNLHPNRSQHMPLPDRAHINFAFVYMECGKGEEGKRNCDTNKYKNSLEVSQRVCFVVMKMYILIKYELVSKC